MANAITFEPMFGVKTFMDSKLNIAERLLNIRLDDEFWSIAREVFRQQLKYNAPFSEFVRKAYQVSDLDPGRPAFAPIELFKSHRMSSSINHELIFRSSGTSGQLRSQHHVVDATLYNTLARAHFESLYGPLKDLVVLALLPSYLEQGSSSLVYMVDGFIKKANPQSRFVLDDPAGLSLQLEELKATQRRTLLIGVSYALLDFAESNTIDYPRLIVMETGGMKGRRQELTRNALHASLQIGFPSSQIHSEYGMTELLSQGYMMDGWSFRPPAWMRAFATEVSDPMQVLPVGQRGVLAFIDLANVHSCSFIQTRDIGIVEADHSFTVEGRIDHSDLRGCNLMYT
jgi:hypothetical protein